LVSERVLLANFVRSIAESFKSNNGEIEIEIPVNDLEFEIDKLRIRLLITNLLNNALRHGKGNLINVRVSFPGDRGVIEVKDNGEGISEEHISQITEPFYRADSARQRNTGGFGLGLYLCRLIAQAHGGEMIIVSQEGKGTQITVNLPRKL
jgi:Osmosensitive K+ channel histidine kinase